jgi:LysM repeat protein
MTEELPPTPPKKKPRVQLKPMAPPPLKAPASTISSYRKRQQIGPFILWGLFVLLLVSGVILLVVWLASGNGPKITLFATETPTPTVTASPTSTATQTATATVTVTATETVPPTPSEPFDYVVQEGDTLTSIAEKFKLGELGLKKLFAANPTIDPAAPNLNIGQKIKIPNPDYQLPTTTPIPTNLAIGTKITYVIESGDTIAAIASKFNSTSEDILKENKITDANTIYAGQQIVVRANLVTPTNPPKPTITQGPSPTPPSPFTVTPPGGVAPSPTVTVTPTK